MASDWSCSGRRATHACGRPLGISSALIAAGRIFVVCGSGSPSAFDRRS
jgi:hypothetical protein